MFPVLLCIHRFAGMRKQGIAEHVGINKRKYLLKLAQRKIIAPKARLLAYNKLTCSYETGLGVIGVLPLLFWPVKPNILALISF